ncbi:MAG: hypothetical protein BGO76_08235 [Caedibacter sp. 38-128]|nr:helix-turn-helix transcriptional regulator [Holosporales bacterium]OJX04123.1 MAG: hypothetical protein BGO76_08235 [Caedibacter sp. 38-128]
MIKTDYLPILEEMKSIAPLIRLHRKKAGLSQQALADLASVARRTISNIEDAEATVQLNILLKVLKALNMSLYISGPFITDKEQ